MLIGVPFGAWIGISILAHHKDGRFGSARSAFFTAC